ncbi:hypothetical protein PFICI_12155 [Pestalotiopsis fici W106-1]|uniref:RING-type domain-containing protein n=1 Tax=Pestalotiopsis fici (strain W106-1 / CGMCC3.15140) TaxID=1229662 RepID=W3WSD5_PESFW|nr:uncharacterized protein PFICI_12155 [Pestalotiopsis fici W106-1]ETS76768.1 hypothetical protein PFICI_12155 [Pestalotiopsis fici W106-1]
MEDPHGDEDLDALAYQLTDGLMDASGTIGAQDPWMPATSGSFRPAVEYNQFYPLSSSVSNLEPNLSGSTFPPAGRHLPSFHEGFGETLSADANQNSLWYLPLSLPATSTRTTTAIGTQQDFDIFRAANVSDNSRQDFSQMPVEPGNSNSLGDAYDNFGNLGGGSINSAAAGDDLFAPLPFSSPPQDSDTDAPSFNQYLPPTTTTTQPQPSGTLNHSASIQHTPWLPPLQQSFGIPAGSGGSHEPNSDDQFIGLLGGDFPSPSLPPLSSSPPRLNSTNTQVSPVVPQSSFLSRIRGIFNTMPTQATSHTAASERGRRPRAPSLVDLTSPKLDREGDAHRALDRSTSMRAPNSRKRTRDSTTGSRAGTTERRTPSSTKSRPTKALKRQISKREDDPFAESSPAPQAEDDVLDLTATDELPPELQLPKVDNRVKLSKFQCSICMDDATALTVTHCGHLFCSECLHSALHIDHLKRTCPICRQKVELKTRPGAKQPKNSFYHLELKLMTANRKGKRPVGQ